MKSVYELSQDAKHVTEQGNVDPYELVGIILYLTTSSGVIPSAADSLRVAVDLQRADREEFESRQHMPNFPQVDAVNLALMRRYAPAFDALDSLLRSVGA